MSAKSKIGIISNILPVISLLYGILSKQYDVIFNSLLTIFCIVLVMLFHRRFPIFNNVTYIACIIFILLSVYAGRTLKFYIIVPNWDKFLHFSSGFVIAAIGKQVYKSLNGDSKNLSLMNWFAFLFAVAAAGIWEFYEFLLDRILHMTAQNGLVDTMLDMIAGSISALIAILFSKKVL